MQNNAQKIREYIDGGWMKDDDEQDALCKLIDVTRLLLDACEFYEDKKTWENAEKYKRDVGIDGSYTARKALEQAAKEIE